MHADTTAHSSQRWPTGSKFGFWLFSWAYFTIFLVAFFVAAQHPGDSNSLDLMPHQPLLLRTLLSVFLSFFPLFLLAPFVGIHLGILVYRSRIQFWLRALVSGFINGFLFIYWAVLVQAVSTALGIAPPGAEATATETFLTYPLIFSFPFLAINMLLALTLFLVYKRSA